MEEMHAPNIQIKYIEDEQTVQIHQTREHEGNTLMRATLNPIGLEYRMLRWKFKKHPRILETCRRVVYSNKMES